MMTENQTNPTEIEETTLDEVAGGPFSGTAILGFGEYADAEPSANGNDLDIQIRTRARGGYSDVKRVAIKIGND